MRTIFVLIFVSIVAAIFWVSQPVSTVAEKLIENNKQAEQKIIVIDPGHGGYDPGAVHGSILEKDINLSICEKLKKVLEANNYRVILTRTGDYNHAIKGIHGREAKLYDMKKRVEIAQEAMADIIITLHVNSVKKTSYQGAEAFYYPISREGKTLALAIQEEFITIPDMNKRSAKISMCYMLRYSKMPSVLVEVGYLSNPRERKLLLESKYRDLLADKIAAGVIKYFNNK
ncbi:N-acetylmuramoyl-L-alanine amidase family protein [Desulfofarcimen acetoxidans]|nr:N-acetylmuramoyl-L-alanine amidase [Desulfofarcimen acetoxidans]